MKLKDYDKTKNLGGVKVKTPKGVIGYWRSQWGYPDGKAGVWLTMERDSSRVFPQFLDSLKQCLEWELTHEDSNCDTLTDMKYIENYEES